MSRNESRLDEALEAEVRSVLRRTILTPPTPEYVRYRVEAMDADSIPTRRGILQWLETPGWTRHRHFALRAGLTLALALVVMVAAGGLLWKIGQTPSPAASLPAGVSVWSPGRILNWDVTANGAGFVYVDGKGLFVTADRGASWSGPRQIPGSDSAQDHYWDATTMDFVDAQHGWLTSITNDATGSRVVEYRTADGGRTWQASPIETLSEPASPEAFARAQQHFTDALHGRLILARVGVATSPCELWSTSDGGATWTGPGSGSCIGLTPTVTWMTRTLGYANANPSQDATVYTSENGGIDWRAGGLGGTWARPEPQLLISDGDRLTLVAREAASGVLPDVVLTSSNGGYSWNRDHEVSAPTSILAYSAIDTQHWVAIVMNATPSGPCPSNATTCVQEAVNSIVETRDGGISWTSLGSQSFYGAWGLRWWDAQHGFILAGAAPCADASGSSCDANRGIFITSDGGRTWHQVNL